MKEYHKIDSIFKRDMDAKGKTKPLIFGDWSKPEFELLKDLKWVATEKIDGTNIRVIWDGEFVTFKGRTERADIPKHLLAYLKETFTEQKMGEKFGYKVDDNEINVCLYGEGYGFKIQKGSNYLGNEVGFILFDVLVGNRWLKKEDVDAIAYSLNIEHVPIIGHFTLTEAVEFVKQGFKSTIAQNKQYVAEGLVLKLDPDLFMRNGQRIVCKIKHVDFVNRG